MVANFSWLLVIIVDKVTTVFHVSNVYKVVNPRQPPIFRTTSVKRAPRSFGINCSPTPS